MILSFWSKASLLMMFSCIFNGAVFAQFEEDSIEGAFFIEPRFSMGRVLDIYPDLPEHTMAFSGQINIAWQTAGKQYWNQFYNFPQVGVLFGATNLGNNDILGQEFSVVPNLSYRFIQFGQFKGYGYVGFGFAYFNKPYDRIKNPENKFIGSNITNKTIFGLNLEYTLSEHFRVSGGICYAHYSNGHYQLPNVGINTPAFELGVKYFTKGPPQSFRIHDSLLRVDKRWLFNIRLGMGRHEFGDPVKPVGGPKYPVFNGSAYLSKRVGMVVNFQTGLHVNYYSSLYDYLLFQDYPDKENPFKALNVIAFAGIEFLIGHFSFPSQMGVYLYNPVYEDIKKIHGYGSGFKQNMKGYLSFKFGAQYYLFTTKLTTRMNPWVGIFIKTNAGQADFAELSFGFAF